MLSFVPPRHLIALHRCLSVAEVSPELSRYVKRYGLDLAVIEARCSFVTITLAEFFTHTSTPTFDFDPNGVPSVVIGWHPIGSETPRDLIAWPLGHPAGFTTHLREAEILGAWWALFGDRPLRLHRTPEDWLRSGCEGCCILNEGSATYWLRRMRGPFIAADVAHGQEIETWLRPLNRAHEIFIERQLAA